MFVTTFLTKEQSTDQKKVTYKETGKAGAVVSNKQKHSNVLNAMTSICIHFKKTPPMKFVQGFIYFDQSIKNMYPHPQTPS